LLDEKISRFWLLLRLIASSFWGVFGNSLVDLLRAGESFDSDCVVGTQFRDFPGVVQMAPINVRPDYTIKKPGARGL
jgi:hypothetical protein